MTKAGLSMPSFGLKVNFLKMKSNIIRYVYIDINKLMKNCCFTAVARSFRNIRPDRQETGTKGNEKQEQQPPQRLWNLQRDVMDFLCFYGSKQMGSPYIGYHNLHALDSEFKRNSMNVWTRLQPSRVIINQDTSWELHRSLFTVYTVSCMC